jgi:hypothetical protein
MSAAAVPAGLTRTAVAVAAVFLVAVAGCGSATTATRCQHPGRSRLPLRAGRRHLPGVGCWWRRTPTTAPAQPFPARGTCHARPVDHGTLPDPSCTPGATDPHVTQATLATTICRAGGYTRTVRPPGSVTSVEKKTAVAAYAATGPTGSYELDHLVSLELGGSPNSPRNLWPQPGASPNPKDTLESALHDLVCSHRMTLADAQNGIAGDWVTTYRQVLGQDPTS